MSNPSAEPAARLSAAAESWPGPKPPDEGWTRRKFVVVMAFVLAFQVALIFLLGTKKQPVPRPVANVPHLQLADRRDEFIALSDPTLFVRPNAHDVVTAYWRRMDPARQPPFNWKEDPRYLAPLTNHLAAVFHDFLQANHSAEFSMDLKPEPEFTAADPGYVRAAPQATTLQISEELLRRRLLNPIPLPSPPYNDVLKPTKLAVLVDPQGNVASATLLDSCLVNDIDQSALRLASRLVFAPGPAVTVGELTFDWHTVPTNAPATAQPANAP